MMRLSLIVVVIMACVACAGSEENLRPGPYVGLSVGYSGSSFEEFADVDEDLDEGIGVIRGQAILGYQMWDRAALEVTYDGGMTYDGSDTDVGINTFMAQGKLFLGVLPGEAFQIYAMGGLGYEWVSTSGANRSDVDGLAWRGGLGLQYYFTKHLPMFVEVSGTQALGEDIDNYHYGMLNVGIMYRF